MEFGRDFSRSLEILHARIARLLHMIIHAKFRADFLYHFLKTLCGSAHSLRLFNSHRVNWLGEKAGNSLTKLKIMTLVNAEMQSMRFFLLIVGTRRGAIDEKCHV